MKVFLIDHDDSFTFNLQSWLNKKFDDVVVVEHSSIIEISQQDALLTLIKENNLVVLSPGPKSPGDYPHIQTLLRRLPTKQKVFGVCLGLQAMVHNLGGRVQAYYPPKHGKTSRLTALNPDFNWLQNINVARYHSLKCSDFGEHFECQAHSQEDGLPMWLSAKSKKWAGVQFHPESFLTDQSDLILSHLEEWMKQ